MVLTAAQLHTDLLAGAFSKTDEETIGEVLADSSVPACVYLTANGTSEVAGIPSEVAVEFDIAERAVAGFALGVSSAGTNVMANFGFLNFALHAADMFTVAEVEALAASPGGLLFLGAVGPGAQLGFQHEWCSLAHLASYELQRVLVPFHRQQVATMVRRWLPSREAWMLAIPVRVAVENSSRWEEAPVARLNPMTPVDANVFCCGSTVLHVLESNSVPERSRIVPVIDLRDPLAGLPAAAADLPAIIVNGTEAESDLATVVAPRLLARTPDISVLEIETGP